MAVVVPALLAFNISPSSTFLNQAAALLGWGAFLAWTTPHRPSFNLLWFEVKPGLYAVGLLACAAAIAAVWWRLPFTLALSAIGILGAAGLALTVAAAVSTESCGETVFRAFCLALLLAGVLSLLVALVQYFVPEWADGNWIARAAAGGRAGGNLRQPNHLSSLLLLAMASLFWLHENLVERDPSFALKPLRTATTALVIALLFGVVLTVSRTGTVCVVFLALWGVIDRHLSRFTRVLLWLAPLVYVLCWLGVSEWAQTGAHDFAGATQLHKADPSSSRFGIWANTFTLIAQNPWFGVGWGEFNFAWTLTPFPGRPGAFFDHTHNLPLQFLVELGIPLGTLVLTLLGWALWKAFVACREAPASDSLTVRSAFVMVLMMVVHSMLEYPLWYAYFLLPTAFAFGICLGRPGATVGGAETKSAVGGVWLRRTLLVASIALVVGAVASVVDYMRVVVIFAPPEGASPLSTRIAEGQRSWFFAHHADYAAATTADHPAEAMDAFKRAPHYLLDTRLMMAWAHALNDSGDVERARYIAQRLKEFRNPGSDDFFAECDAPRAAGEAAPFQCTPPSKAFTYEDFRQR
ncbi:MAG: Wzy polymerase domain-containing protein [Rhizobacter sp.]